MVNIDYSWTVVESSEEFKAMTVEYRAEGFTTYTVGVPLPVDGISLENRIRQYAPIRNWEFELTPVIPVEVGSSGTNTITLISEIPSQNIGAPAVQGPPQ